MSKKKFRSKQHVYDTRKKKKLEHLKKKIKNKKLNKHKCIKYDDRPDEKSQEISREIHTTNKIPNKLCSCMLMTNEQILEILTKSITKKKYNNINNYYPYLLHSVY